MTQTQTQCNICGKPAIVEIAGISNDTNLCEEHITPPYDQEMVRRIFNDIKTETVVSFMKNIHDRIQQDKLIRATDARIQEIMDITGLNKIGQIEQERDEARSMIRELEAKLQAQFKEMSILNKNLDKSGELQKIVEESESRIKDVITDSKDATSEAILMIRDSIISKLDHIGAGSEKISQTSKRAQIPSTSRKSNSKRGEQGHVSAPEEKSGAGIVSELEEVGGAEAE